MPFLTTPLAVVATLLFQAPAEDRVMHTPAPDSRRPAHGTYDDHGFERPMRFPDTADGSMVLTVDLHTHSVFSDGHVWPTIRVEEADRDGLDALAFTDHLEHQPKQADIPHPDRNRAFEVATQVAGSKKIGGVMLINGAEISRGMPPGHVNAVFLQDANKLLTDDAENAVNAANDQGAFVFWNHPNWLPQAPDGVAKILPFHKQLIRTGKLHGVEVANGTLDAYSEDALAIALEYNLTVLGTSDIHGLVDWTHNAAHGGHRPLTLVMSQERTPAALKQALFDGKTTAWINDDLIGKAENVEPVVRACLSLQPKAYLPKSSVLEVSLINRCPLAFTIENKGERTFHNVSDVVRVERYDETKLQVRMNDEQRVLALDLVVLNTQVRPREHLRTMLSVDIAGIERP
ncbi:Sb-PDE family phosphodiesterase [Parasphingorhabdus sp.]|uniref:Sb-PDE family phosphodiesterase n=1 Tax=Parasphingorhabdus sp. TaxID=2709688 RepID=UPI002B277F38|nr:Sb-PDE family phosphodiesterase [Parasphingorhabdus sp.]